MIPGNKPAAPFASVAPSRALVVVLSACFLWAYGSTFRELHLAWSHEPDYAHGYLVVPAVLFFLWLRRAQCPQVFEGPQWGGLTLLLSAAAMRLVSAKFFLGAFDGWSIPVALCGLMWLHCGREWLAWSWAPLAFLVFMVPLPWRAESLLSGPLQSAAASASCWLFQSFGMPAAKEGNTILLGDVRLEVEQACSGLRMLMGVAALVFAVLLTQRASLGQRALYVAGIVPIAMAANVARIFTTGLLFRYVSTDAGMRFAHDFAGLFVIPAAALLIAALVRYANALVIEMEPLVISRGRS